MSDRLCICYIFDERSLWDFQRLYWTLTLHRNCSTKHKQDWLLFLTKFSFTNIDQHCDRHHTNNITTTTRTRPTGEQDNIEKISQPVCWWRWWWRWWWCYKPITNNIITTNWIHSIQQDFVRSVRAPLQVCVCKNMKTQPGPSID